MSFELQNNKNGTSSCLFYGETLPWRVTLPTELANETCKELDDGNYLTKCLRGYGNFGAAAGAAPELERRLVFDCVFVNYGSYKINNLINNVFGNIANYTTRLIGL